MNLNTDFLRVKGKNIVNGRGESVRLRGVCFGGWLNMENFITGYPANESDFRAAITKVLGEGKAKFFFDRFLDYFITEDDIRFLKELGTTVVRIPLNFRHFESDDKPFEYKNEGFKILDKVISWCRKHQIYVILDLHAAPGWQNPDWHSDNPGMMTPLWNHKHYQDRVTALWKEFARRYRKEIIVVGYNILNEPVVDDILKLNVLYHQVTSAIRKIDSDHILFLEGSMFSRQFDQLESPFDDNTVYSSHNYVVPGFADGKYPGEFEGKRYDRKRLEREFCEGGGYTFMQRHGVPIWVGEFGSMYEGRKDTTSRLKIVDDMISIFEQYRHHWTIWTYKDIGMMGLICTHPESEWMRRTLPVREKKKKLRCDFLCAVDGGEVGLLTNQLINIVRGVCQNDHLDYSRFQWRLNRAIHGILLSEFLLPLYAEQFRDMNEKEIDSMMKSFGLKNCIQRVGLVDILKKHC